MLSKVIKYIAVLVVASLPLMADDDYSDGNLQSLNLRLGYTSPQGIGQKQGYGTVGLFGCQEFCGQWLIPFLDLRVHCQDNGKWAGNFGAGVQAPSEDRNSALRAYVFYDFRDTNRHNFNQVMAGVQWLGPRFDITLNTYWPTRLYPRPSNTFFDYPGGYFAVRKHYQFAMRGVELNFGADFSVLENFNFYASIGPYYFWSNRENAVGGQIILEAPIFWGFSICLQGTYDDYFNARGRAAVNWIFPFGCDDCGCDYRCCRPIQRQELIVLGSRCHFKTNY